MNDKVLKVLEYDKILNKLADLTTSVLSRQEALNLLPSTDLAEIVQHQRETSEAFSMIIKKGNPPIHGLHDIWGAIRRAEIGAILNPKELLEIGHSLKIARRMQSYYKDERNQEVYPILEPLFNELKEIKELEKDIERCIISEEEISDYASPELNTIRRQLNNTNNKIRELLNDIIHSPKYQKYLQEPIITVRGNRYVIPVKSEWKPNVPGLVHDSSATGATLFIEPMAVVEANNVLRQLKVKEKAEIERILVQLTNQVNEAAAFIKTNVELIVKLDFIFAKAKLSLKWDAVEPKMNNSKIINIKKGRHPLLDRKTVVAIDIYMGKDFDTLVITGPNTGGKTVTLKTLGLFTLLAQSGLHVPANDGTELAVFQKVFADIGDEQSIEQSLSTFSSHMTNIVQILKQVDEHSLVLFDELGAGTDPTEGAALAMSILEYLHQIGAMTAATTHYSELKLFALSTPGIKNASCEFDVNTLKPTYKLLIGVPGKSNAFAISSRLGLDENLIERAKEFISQENIKFEDVITNLEKNRQIAEQEKEMAIRYKYEVEKLKDELQEQKEKLRSQRQKLLNEAKREARKIIQQAQEEAEETIAELRRIQKENEERERNKSIEQVRQSLRNKINELDQSLSESVIPKKGYSKPPKKLKPGDAVFITTLNQKGTVLNIPDNNGEVQIQAGILKINVHISNLRLIEEEKQDYSNTGIGKISMSKSSDISPRLDVRGQMLEEAIMNTDKYLDDATLSGLNEVTIIHGKGTGTLRTGIHNMLKTHRHVKSFRLGKYGEGETGVTIVELK